MKCSICHNDTNHKSGICIACNFNNKFGLGQILNPTLPEGLKTKAKSNQGTKRGHAGAAPSPSQNPYLLDDLQLLILAQVGYIFDLAKEGKLKKAVNRIKIVSKAVKNGKN